MQITEINATKLPDIGIKRVAAYARVSSEKGEALHSLSAQISYYNEYISSHIGWEFAGVYADEGISGTKDSRPEFQSDIKKHYLTALERLLVDKTAHIADCQTRLGNDEALSHLKEMRLQAEISLERLMAEIQDLVHENARKSQDQQKYRAKFNKLVQRIDEQKGRIAEFKEEELKMVGMREKLHRFIAALERCENATVFTEQDWGDLVERVIVKADALEFEFKNNAKIKVSI